jgi:hypothetical protein
VYDNWCCIEVDTGTWISHCPDLRLGWIQDADGTSWALLGLAIETLETKMMPLEEMARTSSAEVPDLYQSWAGRWVLIGQKQVHMDASGLLGCYYGTLDGSMWVSSSPALLARILFANASPAIDTRPLRYAMGISWVIPPCSRFHGMYRLLPSQVLDLGTKQVHLRSWLPPLDRTRSYKEVVEHFTHSLVTTLKRLAEVGCPLWLGLSAGYDSRTLLALCRHVGINVTTFTRLTARMSVADQLLPPTLARVSGYEHVFMRAHRRDSERQALMAEHCVGHVSEGDAVPFLQRERDGLEGIAFGGHAFEIFSGDYERLEHMPTIPDVDMTAQQIVQRYREPMHSSATADLRAWLAWIVAHPLKQLDWRDRFYLEQENAGWLSSKEQLYDLDHVERFPVLNAARNYALLLALLPEYTAKPSVQLDIIRHVAPDLLTYPFNPDDLSFGIWQVVVCKSFDLPQYIYGNVMQALRRKWPSVTLRG